MFENLVQFGSELRCPGIVAHNPQKLSTSAGSDPTLTVARSHRRKRRKPYSWPWLFPHIIEGEKKRGDYPLLRLANRKTLIPKNQALPSAQHVQPPPPKNCLPHPLALWALFPWRHYLVLWSGLSSQRTVPPPSSAHFPSFCVSDVCFSFFPPSFPPLTVQIAQEERGKTSIPSPRHKIRLLFALLDAILQLFPVKSSVTKAFF